ncbi:MAG TPA: DUF6064 family protein [Paracoccaceae bacterium]|nr:DUF6064 family protein [Paracoccaceae bacterium]
MPFGSEGFAVFARYNLAVWPLQVVAGLLGFAAINGALYHMAFFAEINPAAYGFGAVFLAQAAALAITGLRPGGLRFAPSAALRPVAGLALILFAVLIYPVWGRLAGHAWPAVPVFGVAPCPTTLFTIGMLFLGSWRQACWLLAFPFLWALIGGSAAILLDVPQDAALLAAAALIALLWLTGEGRAAGARA